MQRYQHSASGKYDIMKVLIKMASSKESECIVELLMDCFGYVFMPLFNYDYRSTRWIMRQALVLNRGNHAFGYRSFHLAFTTDTGECVGLIKTEYKHMDHCSFNNLFVFVLFAYRVALSLGLRWLNGLFKNIKKVISAAPIIHQNELMISYLAVNSRYEKRGIGEQLLIHAHSIARRELKEYIGVEVRESNRVAHTYFQKHGFSDIYKIRSASDELFGRGARIRMRVTTDDHVI